MKKLVFLALFFVGKNLGAQQFPYLNSEVTGPQWHNPASFGTWNHRSVNLIGQLQWPELNIPIRSGVLTGEYLFWKSGWPVKLGFGATLLDDRVADLSTTLLCTNTNVQFKFGNAVRLSLGVSPGIWAKTLHADILATDSSTVLIPSGRQVKPYLGTGIAFYWPNVFYVGASMSPIFQTSFNKQSYAAVPHIFLNGAYRFRMNRKFALLFYANAGITKATHKYSGMIFLERIKAPLEFKLGAGYSNVGELKFAAGIGFRNFWVNYFFAVQSANPLPGEQTIHEVKLSWQIPKFVTCLSCEIW